jgi:hypothetical protein
MLVDALDDALTVFAATAPNYGRLGLANHGPMAAEALDHLGRTDAIEGWVARYRSRLEDAQPPGRPLTEDAWPEALGNEARYPEWLALFERELADRPPAAVVSEWVPRLLPGTVGAAAHGLIRTAHALRGLSASDTPPRRLEVAAALALWGSAYQELPGPPVLIGRLRVVEALGALPYLPEEAPRQVLISDMVAQVTGIADEFEQGVSSLAPGGGAQDLLDQVASGGALAYLRNADAGGAIGLLHSVTAPLACELHVAFAVDRHGPAPARSASSAEALVDMAIDSGDEHAIKLTEAALRAYKRCGDPTLLWAAADACVRL